MYVCIICVPGTHKSQKKVSDLLELETADCKLPVRCWESNPGPVEEEPVLFTAGPSLQPEGGGREKLHLWYSFIVFVQPVLRMQLFIPVPGPGNRKSDMSLTFPWVWKPFSLEEEREKVN